MSSTGNLTTERTSNGHFDVYWNGARTKFEIVQTELFRSFAEAPGRRAPRYAISWIGKGGGPKLKVVGGLGAAKRLLARRLATAKAEGK